jgi:outer membrane receptor protein involved in Fe transport
VVTVGGRGDHVTTETVDTPLKTNFTPSESTFTVFNPSLGVSQQLAGGLRAHATLGRAFIPAEASMLTGFTTSIIGGRTQITQGNPDLKPERSTSVDAGLEWSRPSTRIDVTVFRTVVKDRFVSNVIISNPAPPEPVRVSVTNGLDAHISGLDFEAVHRVSRTVGIFGNITQYFSRTERLTTGAERDILSVPMHTLRAGVDLDYGRVAARVSGRFVHSRKDNNFNLLGFPVVTLDDVSVVDANVTYRLAGWHEVGVAINNLFDSYYYETLGYPLQGASFRAFYRVGF